MLGKLLKYEFKATSRVFLPLYALILLLALLNKIFMPLDKSYFEVPRMITMSVYVILIVTLIVLTFVVTINRFYRNLLCDEGYLSFTLPVKTHLHIDAKMLTTLIWAVLSGLISLLSAFILAVGPDTPQKFSEACMALGKFFNQYGLGAWSALFVGIVLLLASILCQTLEIYAAIVIGNLVPRHKLLAGVGAYIGFGIVQQIISSIIASFSSDRIKIYFLSFNASNPQFPFPQITIALLILLAYAVVFSAVFYFLCNWFLSRKLNLE